MTITPIHAATLTGLVDLLNPDPATITLEAMAHGLGKLDRWAGALEVPFSVAQHSGLVADLFCQLHPELRPWSIYARKHDGHEYLIGDLYTPFVEVLTTYHRGLDKLIGTIKRRLDVAIELRFDLPAAPVEVHAAIAEADAAAAHLEWLALMPGANGESPYKEFLSRSGPGQPPHVRLPKIRPKPLAWTAAADQFKSAFERELEERAWERV